MNERICVLLLSWREKDDDDDDVLVVQIKQPCLSRPQSQNLDTCTCPRPLPIHHAAVQTRAQRKTAVVSLPRPGRIIQDPFQNTNSVGRFDGAVLRLRQTPARKVATCKGKASITVVKPAWSTVHSIPCTCGPLPYSAIGTPCQHRVWIRTALRWAEAFVVLVYLVVVRRNKRRSLRHG